MTISVFRAEDGDVPRLFEIASLAFADDLPFFDAMFPRHLTEYGRQAGAKRFLEKKTSDSKSNFLKAVDDTTGEIVGMANWMIFKDYVPKSGGPLPEQYWPDPIEREYAQALSDDFVTVHNAYIKQAGGNAIYLDILTIDPAHQRKGVGGKLVEWGVHKSNELGIDAILESSVPGKGLYMKHGFKFVEDVVIQVPEKFADRPECKYAWLVRSNTT